PAAGLSRGFEEPHPRYFSSIKHERVHPNQVFQVSMPCAVCLHICDIIHLLFHPLSEELLKVRSTIPNFPFPPLRPRIFFLSKCEGSHTLSFIASDEASFRTLKSVKNEFVYASVTPLREIGHIFRNLLKHSLII